jgi:FixJ family two-component response regulator
LRRRGGYRRDAVRGESARSELRASGETIRSHEPASRDALTPQELKVALVVAEGLSNQEAATALFLSPKRSRHTWVAFTPSLGSGHEASSRAHSRQHPMPKPTR